MQLPPDSLARELLQDINRSAVRAAELARQLLAARPAEPAEVVDVGRELAALEPILSRMAGDGIKLVLKMQARPCFVRIEKVHVERIAANLVANARDAMPNGGEVTLALGRTLDADGPGPTTQMIELSVADSGVGMDPLTQERMFEPFYTTKGEGGTGLGLAAVDGIVSRLGGCIRVESQQGRGTKIRVLLPEADRGEVSSSPSTVCGTRPE
jgi:signal transduction histidine kinase